MTREEIRGGLKLLLENIPQDSIDKLSKQVMIYLDYNGVVIKQNPQGTDGGVLAWIEPLI